MDLETRGLFRRWRNLYFNYPHDWSLLEMLIEFYTDLAYENQDNIVKCKKYNKTLSKYRISYDRVIDKYYSKITTA